MGNNHHGHLFCCQIFNNFQNFPRQFRVQSRCRLIKKENLRLHCQRSGNGYPLLLSAGKLVRISICLIFQSHFTKQLLRLRKHLFFIPVLYLQRRIGNILNHRIVGKQVEVLEHQPVIPVNPLQIRRFRISGPAVFTLCSRLSKIYYITIVNLLQHGRASKKGGFS